MPEPVVALNEEFVRPDPRELAVGAGRETCDRFARLWRTQDFCASAGAVSAPATPSSA